MLPELASSGYVFADRAELSSLAETRDGPAITEWANLAEAFGLTIVAGFPEAAGDAIYNSAAVVDPTGLRGVYRKAHLWDTENAVFDRGDDLPLLVDTDHGRIGVMICYDIEFPEWVRAVALSGADLLCAPVNWPLLPRPEGERPTEMVRAMAGAGMNRMPIAVCDRVGVERGQDWIGGSVIIDADGYPLAIAEYGTAGPHHRRHRPRRVAGEADQCAQRRARRPPHRPLPSHRATGLTAARAVRSSPAPTRAPGCPG